MLLYYVLYYIIHNLYLILYYFNLLIDTLILSRRYLMINVFEISIDAFVKFQIFILYLP